MVVKIGLVKYILSFVAGGFLMYFLFFPKITTEYSEKVTTTIDTVFVEVKDTIFITKNKIEQKIIRDTVLVAYTPHIRAFKTLYPSLYGNVSVNGEVLGEVLSMGITTDFKIPTITNNVTTTKTTIKTKTPNNLYVGASVNNLFEPALKADYLNDQFIFSYQYGVLNNTHQIGVSKRLF